MTCEYDATKREQEHPALPEPQGRLRPQGLDTAPEGKTPELTPAAAEARLSITAHFLLDDGGRLHAGRVGTSAYLVVRFRGAARAADVRIHVVSDPAWLSRGVLEGLEIAHRVNPAMTTAAANRLIAHVVPLVNDILLTTAPTEIFDVKKALRSDRGRRAQELIDAFAQFTWIQPSYP